MWHLTISGLDSLSLRKQLCEEIQGVLMVTYDAIYNMQEGGVLPFLCTSYAVT